MTRHLLDCRIASMNVWPCFIRPAIDFGPWIVSMLFLAMWWHTPQPTSPVLKIFPMHRDEKLLPTIVVDRVMLHGPKLLVHGGPIGLMAIGLDFNWVLGLVLTPIWLQFLLTCRSNSLCWCTSFLQNKEKHQFFGDKDKLIYDLTLLLVNFFIYHLSSNLDGVWEQRLFTLAWDDEGIPTKKR